MTDLLLMESNKILAAVEKNDNQRHMKCKEVENQQFVNAIDYPTTVLASELRDHDLVKVNHDNMEYTFAGSSSASQERSSLQSGNPYETEARRRPFQNGKHYDFEGKRKNRTCIWIHTQKRMMNMRLFLLLGSS